MATLISSLPTTTTVYRCASTGIGAAVTTWPETDATCVSYVTACCGADATGAGDGTVACRSCYRPVPNVMGAPVDLSGWATLMGDLGCPCPADCAHNAMWRVEQATDHG